MKLMMMGIRKIIITILTILMLISTYVGKCKYVYTVHILIVHMFYYE